MGAGVVNGHSGMGLMDFSYYILSVAGFLVLAVIIEYLWRRLRKPDIPPEDTP